MLIFQYQDQYSYKGQGAVWQGQGIPGGMILLLLARSKPKWENLASLLPPEKLCTIFSKWVGHAPPCALWEK